MTDKTTAERQRDIAVEALRRFANMDSWTSHVPVQECKDILAQIVALDAPPQPDLAEIGQEACRAFLLRDGDRSFGFNDEFKPMLMAAYVAMRAADPKVQRIIDSATALLDEIVNSGAIYAAGPIENLLVALAAFEKEAKP